MIEQPRGDLAQACDFRRAAGLARRDSAPPAPQRFSGLSRSSVRARRGRGPSRVGPFALGKARQQRVEPRRAPEMVAKLQPPALGQRQRIEQSKEETRCRRSAGGNPSAQPRAPLRLRAARPRHRRSRGPSRRSTRCRPGGTRADAPGRSRVGLKAEGRAVIAIAGFRHRRRGWRSR